mgnify:CR=1 FL=1
MFCVGGFRENIRLKFTAIFFIDISRKLTASPVVSNLKCWSEQSEFNWSDIPLIDGILAPHKIEISSMYRK